MSNDGYQEVWIDGEKTYLIYTPWWTWFGREGDDGLTYLERRYLARQFIRKTRKTKYDRR